VPKPDMATLDILSSDLAQLLKNMQIDKEANDKVLAELNKLRGAITTENIAIADTNISSIMEDFTKRLWKIYSKLNDIVPKIESGKIKVPAQYQDLYQTITKPTYDLITSGIEKQTGQTVAVVMTKPQRYGLAGLGFIQLVPILILGAGGLIASIVLLEVTASFIGKIIPIVLIGGGIWLALEIIKKPKSAEEAKWRAEEARWRTERVKGKTEVAKGLISKIPIK
jgi:hypothetical protein